MFFSPFCEADSTFLTRVLVLLLSLRTGMDFLQGIGGAGGPHGSEHVAVVGERVHPGHGHLSGREQVLVGALNLVVLQGETETA